MSLLKPSDRLVKVTVFSVLVVIFSISQSPCLLQEWRIFHIEAWDQKCPGELNKGQFYRDGSYIFDIRFVYGYKSDFPSRMKVDDVRYLDTRTFSRWYSY